jgi:hypothetical protein
MASKLACFADGLADIPFQNEMGPSNRNGSDQLAIRALAGDESSNASAILQAHFAWLMKKDARSCAPDASARDTAHDQTTERPMLTNTSKWDSLVVRDHLRKTAARTRGPRRDAQGGAGSGDGRIGAAAWNLDFC